MEVLRAYSNRSDLLEQLRKVVAELSERGLRRSARSRRGVEAVSRSHRLHDRFSREDLQAMVDLYREGATSEQVAEKFGVSSRSVRRLANRVAHSGRPPVY